MPIAAPNAAPCETPRDEAEASGLRSTHCITAPDTESAAPTIIAVTTLIKRIFNMAVVYLGSPFPNKTFTTSSKGIFIEPIPIEKIATITSIMMVIIILMRFRKTYLLYICIPSSEIFFIIALHYFPKVTFVYPMPLLLISVKKSGLPRNLSNISLAFFSKSTSENSSGWSILPT